MLSPQSNRWYGALGNRDPSLGVSHRPACSPGWAEAREVYGRGIRQDEKFGHSGMAEDLRLAIARLGGRAEPRRRTARFPRAIFDEAGGMLPLGTLMLQTDLRTGQSGGFRSSVTLPIKSGTGSYSGDVARTTSTFALGRGQN